MRVFPQNPTSNLGTKSEIIRLCSIPDRQQGIRCKAPRSDDQAHEVIRRKEERSKATQSFDFAQDREPVERPFGFAQGHELVEWQMMP